MRGVAAFCQSSQGFQVTGINLVQMRFSAHAVPSFRLSSPSSSSPHGGRTETAVILGLGPYLDVPDPLQWDAVYHRIVGIPYMEFPVSENAHFETGGRRVHNHPLYPVSLSKLLQIGIILLICFLSAFFSAIVVIFPDHHSIKHASFNPSQNASHAGVMLLYTSPVLGSQNFISILNNLRYTARRSGHTSHSTA